MVVVVLRVHLSTLLGKLEVEEDLLDADPRDAPAARRQSGQCLGNAAAEELLLRILRQLRSRLLYEDRRWRLHNLMLRNLLCLRLLLRARCMRLLMLNGSVFGRSGGLLGVVLRELRRRLASGFGLTAFGSLGGTGIDDLLKSGRPCDVLYQVVFTVFTGTGLSKFGDE